VVSAAITVALGGAWTRLAASTVLADALHRLRPRTCQPRPGTRRITTVLLAETT